MFRRIETLRFSRESSDLFDRPSINVARIDGGDAFNKVPDLCSMDIDIRYLPNQDPGEILADIRALPDVRIVKTFQRAPAHVSRANPYVRALREAVSKSIDGEALSVGRDGASDAISFLEAGVPAVEFGPVGGGHHGPEEWVSIQSLARYRSRADRLRRRAARVARPGRRQAAAARRRGRDGVSILEPDGARAARACRWRSASRSAPCSSSSSRRRRSRAGCCSRSIEDVTVFAREATPIPGVKNVLDEVPAGEPQTILLLGSDRRYGDGKGNPPRSDTIIVVRLDPDKNATAVMSLPRDLKVTIPGHGTDKINGAYHAGGPKLTMQARCARCWASRSITSST